MEKDSSLHWHGPAWYAGRRFPGSTGQIPGLPGDVDLLEAFAGDHTLSGPLPSCVLIDATEVAGHGEPAEFYGWLDLQVAALETDVPILVLCAAGEDLPEKPRIHAVIDRQVPDDILFASICDLQRTLIRVEEARVRRLTFGRIPGYTGARRHRGGSGLLVIGLGTRFLELTHALKKNVETVGAFDQVMGETYLARRAFDAVILDGDYADIYETLRQLRIDPRYVSLPVLAIASHKTDVLSLFKAGASDVIFGNLTETNLKMRLATAIRSGKRRRLADRVLAESHHWLTRRLQAGGISRECYDAYLMRSREAAKKRGLDICELVLLPHNFAEADFRLDSATDLFGTVLSVADATSREEDLVCYVQDLGPMAVLKNERGKTRLEERINAILSHTQI
ncbi:MAG: hypothetical protein HWE23_17450 [Rhodobacteraceae bacterium]|nr:hypothetical protein [Paracoccaceae bacterium]